MSHLCPGKEAEVASDDLWLTGEDKVWSKRQQRIFPVDAEQAGFVMQVGRRAADNGSPS
jgi:hypothetical protein